MNDKADWHKEFNRGFVPILEVPSGEMFPESQIVANFGLQAGGENGLKLVSDDPI